MPGLSPSLFSGGAIAFNSDRFTDYYVKQLAHEEAQKEATFRYLAQLGSTLNKGGLAKEDADWLMQKKNEWQAYNISHKDQISNTLLDKGEAWSESNRMYNEMNDHIQRAKAKSDFSMKVLSPIIRNPARAALLTDETNEKIYRANLPVQHPDHRDMTLDDIEYKSAPYDEKDQKNASLLLKNYGKGDYGPETLVKSADGKTQHSVKTLKFSPESLSGMQAIANTQLHKTGFQQSMKEEMQNPQRMAQLNDIFKEQTGRDMQNPFDHALARMIELNPTPRTVEGKEVTAPYAMAAVKQGYSLDRERQRTLDDIKKMGVRNGFEYDKTGGLDLAAKDHLQAELKTAVAGQPQTFTTDKGSTISGYPVQLDKTSEASFAKPDATGKKVPASMIIYDPKSDRFIGLHPALDKSGTKQLTDANGNIIVNEANAKENIKDRSFIETTHREGLFGKPKTAGTAPGAKPKPSATPTGKIKVDY